jgi:hypothetical protein
MIEDIKMAKKTNKTNKQTEFGILLDMSKTSKNVLANTKKNREIWRKNPSLYDLNGVDTKAKKDSQRYQRALKNWRKSPQFKKRYGKKIKKTPKSKEIIPDLWELESIPSELYGEFNNIQEYHDFLEHIEPQPKKLPKKKIVKKKQNVYNRIFSELKKNYSIPAIFQNDKNSITIESVLTEIGIDPYISTDKNFDRILKQAEIDKEIYEINQDYRMKQKLKAQLKKSRLKKSKITLQKRKDYESTLPKSKSGKIILPNTPKNRKRLEKHPKLRRKYLISRGKKLIPNTKKNSLRIQNDPKFAKKHKLMDYKPRTYSNKPRITRSINSRLRDTQKIQNHLMDYANFYVSELAHKQNWNNSHLDSYLENLTGAIEQAVEACPRNKQDHTRLSKHGDVSEIFQNALEWSTNQSFH